MNAKIRDKIYGGLMYISSAIVIGLLLLLIGFVLIKGIGEINGHFLTADFDDKTSYVECEITEELMLKGETVKYDNSEYIKIISVNKKAIAQMDSEVGLKKGDIIKKIGSVNATDMSAQEFNQLISDNIGNIIKIKITRPGDGIFPLLVNTFYMIFLSLLISLPISVFSAIYLAEYAKKGKLLSFIRFATGCLSGIPSIIYGLFGMLVFVTTLKMDFSLLAGACTLSIILLPILIGQTEEAILRVPNELREGSYALGITKLETIFRIVLPNSISGITVGILLSIGRIVAESAALLLTAGTVARIPGNIMEGASTLTVRMYIVAKETGDIRLACAMGIISIALIIIVNLSVNVVEKLSKVV